jgi:hypothetical protein
MSTINERLDALMEKHGVEPRAVPLPVKIGNKSNVVAGGAGFLGQRFPVTLYAPSWLWLLREENVEALIDFIEANEDTLSWGQ